MTTRAPDSLHRILEHEHAALRRALVVRHALRAACAGALAISVAVLAGLPVPGGPGLAATRLTLAGLALLAILALAVVAFRRARPRFDTWLEASERRFPELRSWLRNALDLEGARETHTSRELADAVRAETATRLRAVPLAAERPRIGPRTPLLVLLAAVGAIALAAGLAPQATLRSWRTLWNPALAAPPLTLAVEPGSVTLAPGATLAVRARVGGSGAAPRLLGDGVSPAPQLESTADGVRHWRFDLPPVTRPRTYAVRVLAARSPDYHIALAGEPQPVSFSLEVRAPAYARLPVQAGTSTSGDLAALRGSVVRVEVTFDRDLESLTARTPEGREARWSAITPRRWRGAVSVLRDGEWGLRAEAASGSGAWRWRVSALADAPPVLTVAAPVGDTDLPPGSRIPYDVLAQDDLGLASLQLQYRKQSEQPWRDVPLATFAGEPREARVTAAWDAAALALLPGESGSLRFVLRDDNRFGGPGIATSPEFRIRFPTLTELYSSIDDRQEAVQQTLQKAAEQARELQKSLDQLQRQQPRPGVTAPPQHERAEEMRRAAERQREMAKQLDHAADETRQSVSDAAERDAFREDLTRKLREMADLVREIQSPEFKDALQRMQKALERMDRQDMERSLQPMREQNRSLMERLERSLSLLRQMRDEEKLDALSRRAEELKAQQDAMNRDHAALEKPDASAREGRTPEQQRRELADRERQAAERSEQLAKDARDASEQMSSPDSKGDLQAAADQLQQQAAGAQREAAEQSASQQSSQARQSGEQASENLDQAAQRMNRSNQAAAQARAARQLAAVRRSAQDLVSLGQQAGDNLKGSESSPGQADRQTDLSEGVARVSDSLAALGRETPLLSPEVQQALGRAMEGLSRSGREMAQGNPARGRQEGRDAQSALGQAINGLRGAEQSMCDKPGNKPGGKQGGSDPREALGQTAGKQGQLNERSRELTQRLSQAMRLSAGDQAELRRLADDQARIRGELEQIQKDDASKHQLLGKLDQARQEMKEVEEQLRQGSPGDDLEERQTRILSRMLDAQRSLNRRDFDPQREAQRGQDIARTSPPPLRAERLAPEQRLRLDLMKADADRYPAQYRALVERYLKRLNGNTP
jgi:hypothetical protein